MTKEMMDSSSSKNKSVRRYVLSIFEFIHDTVIGFVGVLYYFLFIEPLLFFARMSMYNYTSRWDILKELQKEFRATVFGTCKYKEVCELYKKGDEICNKESGSGCERWRTFEIERGQVPIY